MNPFPENIYTPEQSLVPDIQLTVVRHENLGDNVICNFCTVNGQSAKRITQTINGRSVNPIPCWNLDGRIVADWFATILEAKYQAATDGAVMVVVPNYV